MILELLPQILSGIASIAALWFTYNQYTKNKLTDYKIEKWKKDEEHKCVQNAHSIATIYGELWELLFYTDASRVYLLQPHPLYKEMYVSATLEVKQPGIATVKQSLDNVPIETAPRFASELANKDFMFIEDITSSDVADVVKSIFLGNGCKSVGFRRLVDSKKRWVGTIVIGFTDPHIENIDTEQLKTLSKSSALAIQYILPEYKTE